MDQYSLAKEIQALDFDTVFRVEEWAVVELHGGGEYAPDVWHDETGDVTIDGERWKAITGMTGQYGYHGAVMHASEFVGSGIAQHLAEDYDPGTLFAMVIVNVDSEDDGEYPEPAGWAIVYRNA